MNKINIFKKNFNLKILSQSQGILQQRYLTLYSNKNKLDREFMNSNLKGFLIKQNFYIFPVRFNTTSSEIVTYDEIKKLSEKKNGTILIDVREPDELKETGQIPGSVNIPLNDLTQALSDETDSKKFKNLYGIDKPSLNTPLIFHCKIGKRAQNATNAAKQLGFKNVRNYKGSWAEWAEKEGLK